MSQSIEEWLSSVDETPEEPSHKRRKLFQDYNRRSRSKSDSVLYSHALTPPSHSPEHVDVVRPAKLIDPEQNMAEENRQMPPPPSPRTTQSGPGTKPYSASNFSKSSSRASVDQIESASYRIRILAVNNVFFKRRHDTLPPSVRQIWSSVSKSSQLDTTASLAPEMNSLLDAMYTREEGLFRESEAREDWRQHKIFPPGNQRGGLYKTDGTPFNKAALPRSTEPDVPTISQPFPDQAYGYSLAIFPSVSEAMKWETSTYQLAGGLFFPFLVIEAKSQSMGRNLWQATNQCAGGGSACVNAITSLLDRKGRLEDVHQADDDGGNIPSDRETTLSGEDEAGYTFSLAIDTEFARLHVHWRDEDRRRFFLHPVQSYDVWNPLDLTRLQRHLSAIIEWGMGDRLKIVKETLNHISRTERRKRSYIESLG